MIVSLVYCVHIYRLFFEVVLFEGVTSIVYLVLLGFVVVLQVTQRAVRLRAVLPVPSSVKFRLVSLRAARDPYGP